MYATKEAKEEADKILKSVSRNSKTGEVIVDDAALSEARGKFSLIMCKDLNPEARDECQKIGR